MFFITKIVILRDRFRMTKSLLDFKYASNLNFAGKSDSIDFLTRNIH